MADIDSTGYILKPTNEWYAEELARYRAIDPDWNLDPSSPDGLKAATDAEIWGGLDQLLQQAYNSKDPDKAAGVDLDVVCALTGTKRAGGPPSTVALTLLGTSGTVVPAGSRVGSEDGSAEWTTDFEVAIDGPTSVQATATVQGAISAPADSVTVIIDVVPGWASVTNPAPAEVGSAIESDPALRQKRRRQVAGPGSGFTDSIVAAVEAVPGVRATLHINNRSDAPDSNGVPGRAFALAVLPSAGWSAELEQAVAQALYSRVPPALPLHGDTSVPVTSTLHALNSDVMVFQKARQVPFSLRVVVTNGAGLPSGAASEIANAVEDYVNGTYFEEIDGSDRPGPFTGGTFSFRTLVAPIQYVLSKYSAAAYVSAIENAQNAADITDSVVQYEWYGVLSIPAANVEVVL